MVGRLIVFALLTLVAAASSPRAETVHAPTIVYVGDSLTAGEKGTYPYTHYINLQPWHGKPWVSFNIGVGGKRLTEMAADADRTLNLKRGFGLNVAVIWGGTNDLAGHHGTPAEIFAVLRDFARGERRLGFKVFVMTMISRDGAEGDKNAYNALIRANWAGFADGLIDLAAEPALGADGAFRNPVFSGDGVHLADKGYAWVGALAQGAINRAIERYASDPQPGRAPYPQRPIAQ